MIKKVFYICVALALVFVMPIVASTFASAATVSYLVQFTASGFTSNFGQPVPRDPVTGSFVITFDTTQTYTDSTSGIILDNLNLSLDSAISFSYNSIVGELIVGGIADSTEQIQYFPPTNDFWLHIYTFTTTPTFQQLGYTQTSVPGANGNLFYTDLPTSGSGTVTVWPNVSNLGNGWNYLTWFGYFNAGNSPWIYHNTLDWLYPYGTSTDNLWFYDPAMGAFWWTSATVYPYVYRARDGAWLYYDVGSTNPRWFFNFSTNVWESD